MRIQPTPVDPPELHHSPAFAQGMIAPAGPTLYIGGQNGTDGEGALLDGLEAQTEQALRNVLAVLAEAGADQSDVVRLAVYLVDGESVDEGYAASAKVWGMNPTALTVIIVPRLGRPDALVEIEAVAALE